EAIALQRSGAKVPRKPAAEYEMPAELKARLDSDPALSRAFAALSPGRQKGYLIRIAAAKQSSTRASRVEKYAPQILAGKGLNE
ncbi:MAG TPA: YdeI/OmpD-associated family protein, partial [Acidobacteriaceae bacterium]|nr:YdeI/OmpD-associated family protein [Acidobacteriaceae bacterium]